MQSVILWFDHSVYNFVISYVLQEMEIKFLCILLVTLCIIWLIMEHGSFKHTCFKVLSLLKLISNFLQKSLLCFIIQHQQLIESTQAFSWRRLINQTFTKESSQASVVSFGDFYHIWNSSLFGRSVQKASLQTHMIMQREAKNPRAWILHLGSAKQSERQTVLKEGV